jgi:hypothetical protein
MTQDYPKCYVEEGENTIVANHVFVAQLDGSLVCVDCGYELIRWGSMAYCKLVREPSTVIIKDCRSLYVPFSGYGLHVEPKEHTGME